MPPWLPGPARLLYVAVRVNRAAALWACLSGWAETIGPGDVPSHPEATGWALVDAFEVFAGWLSLELIVCTLESNP